MVRRSYIPTGSSTESPWNGDREIRAANPMRTAYERERTQHLKQSNPRVRHNLSRSELKQDDGNRLSCPWTRYPIGVMEPARHAGRSSSPRHSVNKRLAYADTRASLVTSERLRRKKVGFRYPLSRQNGAVRRSSTAASHSAGRQPTDTAAYNTTDDGAGRYSCRPVLLATSFARYMEWAH